MTDKIRPGLLLLEDGASLPESITIATERYSAGWSAIIGSNSTQLSKQIEKAGWTFFYMAGEVHAKAYGTDDQSRTDRAMAQITNKVKLQNCNCIEITDVRRGSFLGFPYISLVAHARHIQKSRNFHDLSASPSRVAHPSAEWLYDTLPPRRLPVVPLPAEIPGV